MFFNFGQSQASLGLSVQMRLYELTEKNSAAVRVNWEDWNDLIFVFRSNMIQVILIDEDFLKVEPTNTRCTFSVSDNILCVMHVSKISHFYQAI